MNFEDIKKDGSISQYENIDLVNIIRVMV